MMPNSDDQIDQVVGIFGTQAAMAEAIGIDPRNPTEWRRRELGIPAKHYLPIFKAADKLGKVDQLPEWFPRFSVNGG